MAISLTVKPAASVATTDFVYGVLDPVGRTVIFGKTTYPDGSTDAIGTPTLGVDTNGATALPAVGSVVVTSASDGGTAGPSGPVQSLNSGDLQVGIVTITLAPAAGDVVNASSPQVLHLSPQALVLTNASAS